MEKWASAGLRRASDLAPEVIGGGVDQAFPVMDGLRDVLPGKGLRRGSTVAVHASAPGSTSLMLALLAETSKAGSWCAVVGMPELGLVAASELGIELYRLALVPYPGPQWLEVVSVLLDGFDVVVAAASGGVAAGDRSRLAARARQRGSVLVPFCRGTAWEGADVTVSVERATWYGLGQGRGRLRSREMVIRAGGKGAAGRPKRVTMWLPDGPRPQEAARPRLAVVR